MNAEEVHQMDLLGVDETGAEEWHCPTCGRRFLLRWPPDYGRKVLTPGDEDVTHVGGKGGLRMGEPTFGPAGPPAPLVDDAPLPEHIEALWRRVLGRIEGEGEP